MSREQTEVRGWCRACGTKVDPHATECPKCGPMDLPARRCTFVRCCGRWLACPGFTNTCPKCGADYNWNGTLLASRSCWGEETGEHPADVARITGREPWPTD